ncbi:hypothetical protein [Natronospira bacteriovora]|uniref:2TM domain-containing protein n=1 Tax=Natronospira bacteriovora TaxID=3069753 RepID=A0ABU0W770_9GAMM|nr:hypothetical protein [Natronospira sp. AB-CW4]MDQ2069779.1 hypothetical protein [Natronospira sp. AB-CW4]
MAAAVASYYSWRNGRHQLYRTEELPLRYALHFLAFHIGLEIAALLVPVVDHGDYRIHLYWAAALPVLCGHLLWRYRQNRDRLEE